MRCYLLVLIGLMLASGCKKESEHNTPPDTVVQPVFSCTPPSGIYRMEGTFSVGEMDKPTGKMSELWTINMSASPLYLYAIYYRNVGIWGRYLKLAAVASDSCNSLTTDDCLYNSGLVGNCFNGVERIVLASNTTDGASLPLFYLDGRLVSIQNPSMWYDIANNRIEGDVSEYYTFMGIGSQSGEHVRWRVQGSFRLVLEFELPS